MPLIILTGPPCSGKTKFANMLKASLEEHKARNSEDSAFCKTLHIINEESELPAQNKFQSYETSFQEKSTRAAIKSAVSHKVGTEALVICDSTNYIKGFRYELYCVARTYRSPHCVVWVEAREDVADSWNDSRVGGDKLPSSLMTELRQRFEAPNDKNRWDFPLFRVDMTPVEGNMSGKDISSEIGIGKQSGEGSSSVGSVGGGISSSSNSNSNSNSNNHPSSSPPLTKSAWRPKIKKISDKVVVSEVGKVVGSEVSGSVESGAVESALAGISLSTSDQSPTIITLSSISSSASEPNDVKVSRNDVKADGTGVWFSGTNIKNEFSSQGEPPSVVISKIIAHFSTATAAVPHASTLTVSHSSADMLYELDRTSKEILDKIVSHQNIIGQEGTPILFTEFNRSFTSQRHIGSVELQRHRRQFVKVNSSYPPASVQDIGASFIDFLATQI